jgi:MFS family permease
MTAFAVYSGKLGDQFGKRRLLFAGLALFAIASLLCTFAPNLPLLVVGRALQGAGAALINSLALALVVDVMPAGAAGAGLGALSATSAVGTMIGPTVGAFLIGLGGWRAIFAINLPVALLVYVILRFTTSAQAGAARAAAAGTAPPLMSPVLKLSLGASLFVNGVMISTLILAPFVLSHTYGLPIHAIGLVMGIGPLMTVLCALVSGRFADKLDARVVTIAGLTTFGLGTLGLALLHVEFGLIGYIIPVMLIGAGWGLFQTSNNHVVLGDAGPSRRGTVSGWLALSRNLGLIAGTWMVGQLFNAVTHGSASLSGSVVASAVRVSFAADTVLILCGLVLVILVYLQPVRTPADLST